MGKSGKPDSYNIVGKSLSVSAPISLHRIAFATLHRRGSLPQHPTSLAVLKHHIGSMLLLTLLPLLAAARAEIMELLNGVPEGWKYIEAPRPEQRLALKVAMTAPNQGLFEQTLYAISTPSHPKYGQYLKRDELKEMLRPKSEATTSVMKWLIDSGVNPESIAEEGEWINFVTPVEVANDLLDTTFGVYEDSRGQRRIRTLQYSVPDQLHKYVA